MRQLDPNETHALTSFIATLLRTEGSNDLVAVNQLHKPGRLNVYIVNSDKSTVAAIPKGNAAYVSSSDVIFIDASYFRLGSRNVLAVAENALDENVLAPLRVYAYFVLAHELGHRQLHRGWWSALAHLRGSSRELEADAFAIRVLQTLYSTETLRRAAHIPETVSTLSGFFGDVTPLQRIVDHLSVAVSFLADELFDSPFPILSQTRDHPAFLGRFQSLLKGLGDAANAAGDEDAIRKMSVARSVLASTTYLLELRPSEIEFNNHFQYAYIDGSKLHVVGRDKQPILALDLAELQPGRQYRRVIQDMGGEPTARYSWPGRPGETITLRRDGRLVAIKGETGDVLSEVDLRSKLGDNSCVKQFILPPQPSDYAYATFCEAGRASVAIIGKDGSIRHRQIKDLVTESKSIGFDIRILLPRTFDVDAAGRPMITFSVGGENYRLALSPELIPQTTVRMLLSGEGIWHTRRVGPAQLIEKATVSDAAGEAFFLTGSPIFRNVEMHSAEKADTEPPTSEKLGPSVGRGPDTLPIAASYPIGDNRVIVNLVEGGAYLADFSKKRLSPIRRQSFGPGEQIAANIEGDWIYYRKYDRRVLVFKGARSGKSH
ncbi:hypothetical protein [Methylobacterium sp. R2-1]|uniref:hypothetical protein n=1 Tax=Methylobacterium sp. R2-1 TaxID=2587064 RepID=UPI00161F2ABB|nr:hypothetical protein [Methylobacterium sp. R2-1]MBB2962533.1 hypothetical protein [Methylobacterium sp. R2-1]